MATHAKAAASSAAAAATPRNGSRAPADSYSQPPIDGPIMKPKPVPAMTMPITRPRSAGPYESAIRAKPMTHVTASAAPCTRRAAKSQGRLVATANSALAAASAASPPTSGSFRPIQSETAPIGSDTVSSVTPKAANSRPIVVGDAPRRRLDPADRDRHRVGDDVGEGRAGDERDGDGPGVADGHDEEDE